MDYIVCGILQPRILEWVASLGDLPNPGIEPLFPEGKESACNSGDTGNGGSVPGSGISSKRRKCQPHSSILAWRIPWTEEPGGLQSMGSAESSMTEATNMHTNLGHVGIPVTLCRSRECPAGFLVLNNHISSCLT